MPILIDLFMSNGTNLSQLQAVIVRVTIEKNENNETIKKFGIKFAKMNKQNALAFKTVIKDYLTKLAA